MNAYSLLLDIGGTHLKLGSSTEGKLVKNSIKRFRLPEPRFNIEGQFSFNACEVLSIVKLAIEQYMREFGSPERILIAGQVGSWILTDESGSPINQVISWQNNSYSQTETYFTTHINFIMPRVKEMMVNAAQYFQSNTPSLNLQYTTSNEERTIQIS